jgi:hypothetical protein
MYMFYYWVSGETLAAVLTRASAYKRIPYISIIVN